MMVEFVCSPNPPVQMEWGDAPLPSIGHILLWKFSTNLPQGKYRVDGIEWQVYAVVSVRIAISPT